MAPIFVASALDSGLALLILALIALEKFGVVEVGRELFAKLSKLLATFVCVDAFFIACELLTMAHLGAGEAVALEHMLSGATAPFFWAEVIGGLAVPFLILALTRNDGRKGALAAASALVVLGVLCKRIWLFLTSFITPNIQGDAGVTVGNANLVGEGSIWALAGSYAPTLVEICIVIGVVAAGVLAFMVLSDKLLGREASVAEAARAAGSEA